MPEVVTTETTENLRAAGLQIEGECADQVFSICNLQSSICNRATLVRFSEALP